MILCLGCMEEMEDSCEVCPKCGYHKDTPVQQGYYLIPGTILHQRYIVGKVLGYGGFGVTYIGWDAQLNRKLAIKEYLPSDFSTRSYGETRLTVFSGDAMEQFRAGLRSFIDEAKRLAKFKSTPGIVSIYDSFIENDTGYIIMEFLDGMTVKEVLKQRKQMYYEEALAIITEVLKGLEKVHAEGIIHRDIAPDNIFITKEGQVKLIDFGAARYASSFHSRSLSVILKPGYAPEEQYRSHGEQGPWTDVYGIGATFYKMLTGITPTESIERSVKDNLQPPSKLGVAIQESQENTLMNSLNIKKEDRIQSATEYLSALGRDDVVRNKIKQENANVKHFPKWLIATMAGLGIVLIGTGTLLATGILSMEEKHVETDSEILEEGYVHVPGFANLFFEEADAKAKENDLILQQDELVYDDVVERDKILAQNPDPGIVIEKNSTINLSISGGKQYFIMPDIVGLEKGNAKETILEDSESMANLEPAKTYIGDISYEYEASEEVSINTVMKQEIQKGEKVDYDQDIVLTISSGSAEKQEENLLIVDKDVTGMNYKAAVAYFKEKGIQTTIVKENSEKVKKDQVISQSVTKGERVLSVDSVELVVSKGPKTVAVPNLQLKSKEEATKLLKKVGLKYSFTEEYSSVAKGKVCAQSVAEGKKVKMNTKVEITISKGPAPVTPPHSTTKTTQDPPPQPQPTPTPKPTPSTGGGISFGGDSGITFN